MKRPVKGELFKAVLSGKTELVRSLLDRGANVNEAHREKVRFSDQMFSQGGCTPLMAAVAYGNQPLALLLLDAGADPNSKEKADLTALHLAVVMEQDQMIPLLVSRGADLESIRHPAETPLLAALSQDRISCAIALVRAGANIHARDGYMKDTALHRAVYTSEVNKERLQCIREILKAGGKLQERNIAQQTPLHYAAIGNEVILALLLEQGADVHAKDQIQQTALHNAVGSIRAIQLLLKAGSDVNAKDKFGQTPLFVAVRRHNPDAVRELIRAGANVNIRTQDGFTPLAIAEKDAQLEICKMLRAAGSSEDFSPEVLDQRLCNACKLGDLALAQELLTKGASANAQMEWQSVLMLAAKGGHAEIVNALLLAGANTKFLGPSRQTPLLMAAAGGSAAIVRRLLQEGARADMETIDGETSLMAACESGNAESVRLLLDAGADPNRKGKQGMNPFLVAARYGNADAVKAMRDAGGKHKLESHFLEIPDFEARLKTPELRKCIAEVSELCGVEPMKTPHLFRSGVFWDLSKTALANRAKKKLQERYNDPRYFVKGTDSSRIRTGAAKMSEMHAVDAAICDVQHVAYDSMHKRGCLLLFVHQLPGNKLALLPTTNPYSVVAWLGPHPKGAVAMLEYLLRLQKEWPWQLYGCSYDELRLRFPGKPRNSADLGKRLFGLHSDERGIVDDGDVVLAETAKEFAKQLSAPNPTVRLWWD